eukprot:CAMPEP_0119269294 /NCGR_PEP_ID=MMETSP1329-20130426/6762_1 /TAXON_ID=114041 /ORGANISM="Genus nov. species nov., Strain RCC1024" /LENGTH=119 /DNA_ID=CAMNT_0007269291 /DNA_START=412 /DNA_END=768 /DNA_ORIENTATION=-
MSFQDLTTATSGGPANWPRGGGGAADKAERVGEQLRQYQHNASLLERLTEHLNSQPRATDELLRQVSTQREVVEELARSLRKGLSDLLRAADAARGPDASRLRASHAKLRKDFDRISDG